MAAAAKPHKPLVVVVGATGTGKSQLAVDIAARFNGEVINGDAMQLYEGLPIITNKIKPEERKGIPHHLLGEIRLHEEPWTVGNFVSRAHDTIADIHGRNKLPVLVGGTHYYLQSLLFGGTVAGNNEANTKSEEKWPILGASGLEMLEMLKEVDPEMASRWHPNDKRKIRRSLEIYLQTGRRASEIYAEQQSQREGSHSEQGRTVGDLAYPALFIWTHTARQILTERLDARVGNMVSEGLLDEVSQLRGVRQRMEKEGQPVDHTRGIWVSIGFKELEEFAEASSTGDLSATELKVAKEKGIEKTRIATRQYARGQVKWIRIKLLNALQDAGEQTSFYIIDTDDPSRWDESILHPVVDLTSAFLDGRKLPDPTAISANAAELLAPKQGYDLGRRPDLWKTKTCEICGLTAVTEKSWKIHLTSKGHRRALKRLSSKAQVVPVSATQMVELNSD